MTKKYYNITLRVCLISKCFNCGVKNYCERIEKALGEEWLKKTEWKKLSEFQKGMVGLV